MSDWHFWIGLGVVLLVLGAFGFDPDGTLLAVLLCCVLARQQL